MRIISGIHKGRRLNPPANLSVRPTTDMAREALFSILYTTYEFADLRVLDLFCGTGALSFEFISRGSEDVTAIDSNIRCIEFIKKTATDWKVEGLHAFKADVFKFLQNQSRPWDIIFADPPYLMKESLLLPAMVRENKLLAPGGRLIIEHPSEIHFSDQEGFIEKRSYSRVQFSFFTFEEKPADATSAKEDLPL